MHTGSKSDETSLERTCERRARSGPVRTTWVRSALLLICCAAVLAFSTSACGESGSTDRETAADTSAADTADAQRRDTTVDTGHADTQPPSPDTAFELDTADGAEVDADAGEPVPDPFRIWVAGDAHIQKDLKKSGYRSLAEALADTRSDEAGFEWDLWVNPGDFTGTGTCPGDEEGRQLLAQLVGFDRHRMYSVPGNHDSNSDDASWFRTYVDPLGASTQTSGVDPDRRPYPTTGAWDHYSFQVGNVVFLMLGDENFGSPPFGRQCGDGYPAGRYSRETWEWWRNQVQEHADDIVVTVAHHTLHETTIYTEFGQGTKYAHDGGNNDSWADQRGSAFIYAIDDRTIDGRNAENEEVGDRGFGFKKYLEEHPGAVDLWLFGHTHRDLTPESTHDGRGLVETVHQTHFVNAGALTREHAGPTVPFSRLLEFVPGSKDVRLRTYLHEEGWEDRDRGFYEPTAQSLEVRTEFEPPE